MRGHTDLISDFQSDVLAGGAEIGVVRYELDAGDVRLGGYSGARVVHGNRVGCAGLRQADGRSG